MAVKDHSLDNLIIESAKKEFLENGFSKASLRNISKNCGITTGALYTRYKDKDELFESLIFDKINNKIDITPINNLYLEIKKTKDVNKFLEAIKYEEKLYLDFLYKYYFQCVLLICKSDGSKIGNKIKSLMETKANGTVEFFKEIATKKIDLDGIRLIMQEQFNYYKMLLEKGYNKEKAISVMNVVSKFIDEGWKKIFEEII